MLVTELIKQAIKEDIEEGDHTSLACIPKDKSQKAQLLVKENGIIAGIDIAKAVFHEVDSSLTFHPILKDGDSISKGDIAFTVEGKARSILSGERLALNFMQRMSGIASHTFNLTQQLVGFKTKLLDTRKTTPNFRYFEKLAVKIGGGKNHRYGLFDMIMIKDNHIDFAGGIEFAIRSTREYLKKNNLNLKIEIEARDLDEVREIINLGGIDRIMLDNFNYEDLKAAVRLVNGQFETEASGGITKETLRNYAECGVDYISVGALTHQINSLDLSLKAVDLA